MNYVPTRSRGAYAYYVGRLLGIAAFPRGGSWDRFTVFRSFFVSSGYPSAGSFFS
jgi:hypothetical protein